LKTGRPPEYHVIPACSNWFVGAVMLVTVTSMA